MILYAIVSELQILDYILVFFLFFFQFLFIFFISILFRIRMECDRGERWHSGRDSHLYIIPISNLLEVMDSIP